MFFFLIGINGGRAYAYLVGFNFISGQTDFKLVGFVFPLFYSHYRKTETKENTNQTTVVV